MANQLSKFVPNMAELTKPLRDLLSKRHHWCWGEPQEHAFTQALTQRQSCLPMLLRMGWGQCCYRPRVTEVLELLAYISRSMSTTEQRYAQIEKEAVALTWACERFQDYLVGLEFHVQTDHKPLVPLFSSKLLDDLPLQIQRFRMRLMRFSFTISHVPGKELSTADALSRAPIANVSSSTELSAEEVDAYVRLAVRCLPATEEKLEKIRSCQNGDNDFQRVIAYCQEGWPSKPDIPQALKPFHSVAGELCMQDGLLMRGSRIVIPTEMRKEVLVQLHAGHQGISKCRPGGLGCPATSRRWSKLAQSASNVPFLK